MVFDDIWHVAKYCFRYKWLIFSRLY